MINIMSSSSITLYLQTPLFKVHLLQMLYIRLTSNQLLRKTRSMTHFEVLNLYRESSSRVNLQNGVKDNL